MSDAISALRFAPWREYLLFDSFARARIRAEISRKGAKDRNRKAAGDDLCSSRVRAIQEALGHNSIKTTLLYKRCVLPENLVSPLDLLRQRQREAEGPVPVAEAAQPPAGHTRQAKASRRNKLSNNGGLAWGYGVIPIAVEDISFDANG